LKYQVACLDYREKKNILEEKSKKYILSVFRVCQCCNEWDSYYWENIFNKNKKDDINFLVYSCVIVYSMLCFQSCICLNPTLASLLETRNDSEILFWFKCNGTRVLPLFSRLALNKYMYLGVKGMSLKKYIL